MNNIYKYHLNDILMSNITSYVFDNNLGNCKFKSKSKEIYLKTD